MSNIEFAASMLHQLIHKLPEPELKDLATKMHAESAGDMSHCHAATNYIILAYIEHVYAARRIRGKE